jgi:hypothetical protein
MALVAGSVQDRLNITRKLDALAPPGGRRRRLKERCGSQQPEEEQWETSPAYSTSSEHVSSSQEF